jgi:hypothetical protein
MRVFVKTVALFLVSIPAAALAGCAGEAGDDAIESTAQADKAMTELAPTNQAGIPGQAQIPNQVSICAPNSASPAYQAPVFPAPTFAAPTFQAPTFKPPTFEAPSYASPTYQAPTQIPNYQRPPTSRPSARRPTTRRPTPCSPPT